jgi:hypothetical protein
MRTTLAAVLIGSVGACLHPSQPGNEVGVGVADPSRTTVEDGVLTGEPPTDPQRVHWIQVTYFGNEIVDMKKEIAIDAATAAKLFRGEFPYLRDDWEKNIPGTLENAADARSIPDDVKKNWITARDNMTRAKVSSFSEKELIVLVIEHKGTYLWQQFYECKALFRIPRGKEVDALFQVPALEKYYGAKYKGLKHGDPESEVTRKLGKPDATIRYQPGAYYRLCFFKDNVIITIIEGCLESIEFGVPQSLKDEVKKSGRELVRF